MKRPSKEIIENARKVRVDKVYNCQAFHADCDNCAFKFEFGKSSVCTTENSSAQFFKDFLAKYDTEDIMDTEKEIEALKARIAKLEGKNTYPCIKKHYDGLIVLFNRYRCGTVLESNGYWKVSVSREDWDESQFTETLTEYTIKV